MCRTNGHIDRLQYVMKPSDFKNALNSGQRDRSRKCLDNDDWDFIKRSFLISKHLL